MPPPTLPDTTFEIFLSTPPGLETALAAEARENGFAGLRLDHGGVAFDGGWKDVWKANYRLRGANRVLARIAQFPVKHLAHLDKLARRIPWGDVLRADRPVQVSATCRKSKIYHAGAAQMRVGRAVSETLGAPVDAEAAITIRVRLDHDICTISVDTSGEPLHKRGFKAAVNKAPMRETLAALFLRECGYDGSETVLDPMCGSGSFVIEAAEIAAGLAPGRARAFAFQDLATFDAAAWEEVSTSRAARFPDCRFFGSDRDPGAIRMSGENAERAGVAGMTEFAVRPVADITPPEGPPGLVMINPPYGARIGNKGALTALHGVMGQVLRTRFSGWRVGLVTSDPGLARATRLPFGPPGPPIDHGGIKIRLYRTPPLR